MALAIQNFGQETAAKTSIENPKDMGGQYQDNS
jgi:hypothetical protein